MWSRNPLAGNLRRAIAAIAAAAVLAGCSFTPLYGDAAPAGNGRFAFRYAEPATRLDRIIYQELALGFGRSRAIEAPELVVTASAGSRRVGRTSSGSPATTYEARVTATVQVTPAGEDGPVYSATRQASASYTTTGQRLTDSYARQEAEERAARAVAQSLKLLVAAELPGKL